MLNSFSEHDKIFIKSLVYRQGQKLQKQSKVACRIQNIMRFWGCFFQSHSLHLLITIPFVCTHQKETFYVFFKINYVDINEQHINILHDIGNKKNNCHSTALPEEESHLSSRWCEKACRWHSPVGRHLCCDGVIG